MAPTLLGSGKSVLTVGKVVGSTSVRGSNQRDLFIWGENGRGNDAHPTISLGNESDCVSIEMRILASSKQIRAPKNPLK